MGFEKTAAVIIGLALAAVVNAATMLITEPLIEGEYTLVPVVAPPVDSDTDGFPDDVDACPDEYGTEPDGCPPPPVDTDGDGLPDDVDACPTEPAQTEDGCPLPPPDADGDGVPDDIDQCADTSAGDTVDSVGCTVTPPDPGDLATTPIGQLAASLQPGEFALLASPSPYLGGYREDGTGAPRVDTWVSSNYWHPASRSTWFLGLRISNRFMSYKADSDSWVEYPLGDEVENSPERFPGTGHTYESIALDADRGHFYHTRGLMIYRYSIAENIWEMFDRPEGFSNTVLEWHDGLDMLVGLHNGELKGWREGQAFDLGQAPVDGYHSSIRFNRKRGDMLMIGGNESLNTVALMLPDGSIEHRADAPFDFHINVCDLTYDPASGNYLVTTEDHELWEYSPDIDEWRVVFPSATKKEDWFLDWYMANVPVVIDDLGVIAWQVPEGFVLHRHQSVFYEPPVVVKPEVPAPPVVIADPPGWTSDGTLLVDEAATMQPGEWRQLFDETDWPGKDPAYSHSSFKGFQVVRNETSGADGMGWTQDLVYDKGRLLLLLNRSGIARALIGMNSDGKWWRLDEPAGYAGTDRRPFNKLMQDDEYLYFAPNGCKTCMGYFIRTPLDNPGVFERYGIPIGDDQMDSVGNFAVEWVPEWGRFYAYTPGGKLWTWTHGEPAWTLLDRLRYDLSGYAGVLVWNPVKKELVVAGGQVFGSNANLGANVARLTEPMGKMELLEPMAKPDGVPLYYTAAQNRLIVDPRDGSYIQIDRDKQIYHNDEVGGTYEFYDSVDQSHGWPLGNYELYAPYAFVPGTDVIVFVSHLRGVVLYRLKSI